MPTRFIKESCRSSRNLDRLTDFEERLFWRLITTADDFGRFLATPELVRAACFPYRAMSIQKVTEALQGLQAQHLVSLYVVADREYGEFVTFEKHQGKARSRKSKYPDKLDASLHADASTCVHTLADVTGHPNTNTDLTLNLKREGSGERGKTAFPDGWKPEQAEMEQWRQHGLSDVWVEFATFRDHAKSNDRRCKDWPAAWRNWCRKALRMKEERANGLYKMRV